MVIIANEVKSLKEMLSLRFCAWKGMVINMEKTETFKNIQKRRALFEEYLRDRNRKKKPCPSCQNLSRQSAAGKK
jgi:hypothetical protein